MESALVESSIFARIPETGGVRRRLQSATRAAHARFKAGLALVGDEREAPLADGPSSGSAAAGAGDDHEDGRVEGHVDVHIDGHAEVHESDMTHAWLFTGPAGSGRSVSARAFAAALLCTDHDNPGCDRCEGCHTALAGTHGDLKIVRTSGTIISVDTVRDEIRPWAYKLPTTADCRVLIVEDADRFNDAAANAMLKLVEEPPLRTVIIMCAPTTNPEDFSVTLRSRCRHIYVPTPSEDDVVKLLMSENSALTEEQARWAAQVSGCHIGRARGLVNDEGTRAWRGKALDFVEAAFDPARSYLVSRAMANEVAGEAKRRLEETERKELEALEVALGIGASGKGTQAALRGTKGVIKDLEDEQKRRRKRTESDLVDLSLTDMMGIYRDALMIASGAGVGANESSGAEVGAGGVRVINPDRIRTAEELARRLSLPALLQSIDAVMKIRNLLGTAVKPAVLLDRLMASLQIAGNVGKR